LVNANKYTTECGAGAEKATVFDKLLANSGEAPRAAANFVAAANFRKLEI
jgi:hypothetical protein